MDLYGSRNLYDYLWVKYGPNAQLDMVLEEQSELAQVILKARRHNTLGTPPTRSDLASEIADNLIMLEQLISVYGLDEMVEANIAYKLARVAERSDYHPNFGDSIPEDSLYEYEREYDKLHPKED